MLSPRQKFFSTKEKRVFFFLGLFLAALTLGFAPDDPSQITAIQSGNPTENEKNPSPLTQPLRTEVDFLTAVENVAQTVGPAVVAIRTEKTERYRPPGYLFGGPFEDELFSQFFEEFFGEQFEQEFKSSGLGSGVIIDPKGYILTNEHVVGSADTILVRLADGREAQGELTGTDPRSDLAVIKIDLPNLPYAKLGQSEDLKTGQWVVAIGNPFGYILENPEPTVTTGVISALQRSLPRTSRRDTDYSDLIQTDAAINPGNSGGPLVNLYGDVIGINVAIFSTSGGYQGIGFAIPISHAQRIVDQLIKGEEVSYGWIGVSVQNIDRRLAEYFDLDTTEGVMVTHVLSHSPAERAGIEEGDVILSIDDKKTRNTSSLVRTIGNSSIGKTVNLQILRNQKPMAIPVTIEMRPNFVEPGVQRKIEETLSQPPEDELPVEANNWRGLKVEDFKPKPDPESNSGLAFSKTPEAGAVIIDIAEGSPAQDTGLRRGDVIVGINKTSITNAQDFYKAVRQARGDALVQTTRGYFVVKEN